MNTFQGPVNKLGIVNKTLILITEALGLEATDPKEALIQGLYPPPHNPGGFQWIPVDSSQARLRPDWLVQCPVQSSPFHWTLTGLQATFQSPVKVQWTESLVRVHWNPVESSGVQWNID